MKVPTEGLPNLVEVIDIDAGTVALHEDGNFYLVAEQIVQGKPRDDVTRSKLLVDLVSGMIYPPAGMAVPLPDARITLN